MSRGGASRRAFLATSGAALATVWLSADPAAVRASLAHAARAAHSSEPLAWQALTGSQAADVEAMVAQIFPSDETPGAREAHVAEFIDHSLVTWAASLHEEIVAGLDDLNGQVERRWPGSGRFAALAPDRQIELLRASERSRFFRRMRLLTLVGMFSSPAYGGNTGKVGWRLIGFEDRFAWRAPFGDYDAEAAQSGA
jgi:hypothetical protein